MEENRLSADVQAVQLREDLSATLQELERRRRQIAHLPGALWRNPLMLALLGGAVVLAAGGVIAAWIARRRGAPRRLRRARVHAVTRVWQHPERVAAYADRPFPLAFLRKGLFAFLAAVVAGLARRIGKGMARAMIPART